MGKIATNCGLVMTTLVSQNLLRIFTDGLSSQAVVVQFHSLRRALLTDLRIKWRDWKYGNAFI